MIERYSRPQMVALWSEEAKYRTWLDVEVLACEAMAKIGKIPQDALKAIHEKAGFDIAEILEREKETKHDVAAFVSVVQKRIGDAGKYVHYGLTSSDVLDTALSYRLKKSGEMLLAVLQESLDITRQNAERDREIPMMGRTHGIHAEPTTMGVKWLLWHDQLKRAYARIQAATEEVSVGKLSGAVGNYAHNPPEVEAYVCEKLGLQVDTLSTQVVSRDRHAFYFSALGLLGSVIESISIELRHLQRTEVGEVLEGFTKGQRGSSAMPHKRNPISAENLTGCGRMLRSMAIPAMENVALWHERDISHSSVERLIGPDANILADYAVARLNGLLTRLEINSGRMQENLDLLQGVIYSQRVLLELIEKGLSRDEAYEIVQKNALQALDTKTPFLTLLKEDARVTKLLPHSHLDVLCDARTYFKHIDYLFKKVVSDGSGNRKQTS